MYELISDVCAVHAHKEAIVSGAVRLRFGALLDRARRIAATLRMRAPGPVVGFCLPHPEAIVFMLACLDAGKVFVPIDAGTAATVRSGMLRTARCCALVERLDLDTGELGLTGLDAGAPVHIGALDGVMSIMFTSGSTGQPKGVMVRRASVCNLLHAPDFLPLDPQDVFAAYSSLSFDASTFEIFTPLLNGNTLVVLDKRDVLDHAVLQSAIRRERISVMWMTAGLFNTLVLADRWAALATLRTLLVGGEKVDPEAARRFVDGARGTALFNGYGPTENTVFTTIAALTPDVMRGVVDEVPLGRPVRGVQCEIRRAGTSELLDGAGQGRLLVSGAGLAAGYVGETGGTAFAAHERAVSGRFYDTGDEVRRDAHGIYHFIGRCDAQVKLNGHRVDLGGVERRCVQAGLAERVHAFHSETMQGLVLVCHAAGVARDGWRHADARLDGVLNAWEKPRRIVFVSDWPLTRNDKTDGRALARRAETLLAEQAEQAGRDAGSDALARLIARLTRAPATNRQARLFDIGFDSIGIARLQAEIETQLGVHLDILDIYEAGSLGGLEELIRERYAY